MPSTDETRAERLAAARRRILQDAPAPFDSLEELARRSQRAHVRDVRGDTSPEPTEVVVRLHGDGVHGHKVAVEHATPLLEELQKAIKWIGSSIRRDLDERHIVAAAKRPGEKRARTSVKDATRLYLEPQFGAGSLVFHLTAGPSSEGNDGGADFGPQETLLDRSVQRLITVVEEAQSDAGEDTEALTSAVRQMGSRAAAAMGRVADNVVTNEIDVDLTWSSAMGSRQTARLRRRGALAIQDAVKRNRVQKRTIDVVGTLETASVGRDLIRVVAVDGKDYRMTVDPELGQSLGPMLNQRVAVRAEETTIWKNGGNENHKYLLLAIEPEATLRDAES